VGTPTAVIAEDEALLRAELREKLGELWPELEICAEATDGIEAVRAIGRFSPQVLFLDIQMPGLSGLDVARQVCGRAIVVFITAYDQHAFAAFEHGALDYVPKPITMARLSVAVERVKDRLRATLVHASGPPGTPASGTQGADYLRWITVPYGNGLRVVTAEDICYLRADNKYAVIVTSDTEYLVSSTLKQMHERLDPRTFWRVHRSVVVNVAAIQAIHRGFNGTLEIQLKQRKELLPVSSAHAHLFKHL
jgi:DNA-binding LytR/AlgR family response regulator